MAKSKQFKPLDEESVKVIEAGKLKSHVRSIIVDVVTELHPNNKKKIRGLTLPATEYIFEQELLSIYKNISFVCLERSPKIYNESLKRAELLNKGWNADIKLYNLDDLTYFKKYDDKFDFIWLDYCGAWAKGKEESFHKIFSGNFLNFDNKRKPLIALTVTNGGDFHDKNRILEISANRNHINKDGMYNIRTDGIPKIIGGIATEYNKTAYPLEICFYRDQENNNRKQGLFVYVFQIYNTALNLDMYETMFSELRRRRRQMKLNWE